MSRYQEKSHGQREITDLDDHKDARYTEHLDSPSTTRGSATVNPLAGIPKEQLFHDVDNFCREKGLEDKIDVFRKGALVAQRPSDFDDIAELDEADRAPLRAAHLNKWHHPRMLYFAGECVLPSAPPIANLISHRLCYWSCNSGLGSNRFQRCQ
jgi:hypothetical protein